MSMDLTEKEKDFVAKRAKLIQAWPLVGSLLLCLLIGLGLWLYFCRPLLANPMLVISKLESDAIPVSMLTLMAGLLPLCVLMCLLLTVVMVLFGFTLFANERKYHRMIQRLVDPQET